WFIHIFGNICRIPSSSCQLWSLEHQPKEVISPGEILLWVAIMFISSLGSVGNESWKVSDFVSGFGTYKIVLYNTRVAGSIGLLRS
ncbi:hypothetical protein MKX03_008456, partial [Papaver bracteatum]